MAAADTIDSPFQALRLHGAGGATADFCLYGGQLLSWRPGLVESLDDERLFLSTAAVFNEGAAIRGGVPVIFPQFAGRGSLPKHGFARQQVWSLVSCDPDAGLARLRLIDNDATRAIWPQAFQLDLEICLDEAALELRLHVVNTGSESWEFTSALHTYLRVEDVASTHVEGLQGLRYIDTADRDQEVVETEPFVHLTGEVDRIYQLYGERRLMSLVEARRRLAIEQEGFSDVVVWNPGVKRAAALKDLDTGSYRHFVCVEAALATVPVRLAPGEAWAGVQRLRAS